MLNRDSSSRPVRLRERLREQTAEAILAAAEEAFAAEGPKARMESIALRAGIAVGTLYNHFEDREALWAALCRSRRQALLVRLDTALDASGALAVRDALRAFLDAFVAHWEAHRGFLTVMIQAEPVGAPSPRGARDRTMADELLDRATILVRRGVERGELRADGAALFPVLLLGTIRALLVRQIGPAAAPGTSGVDVEGLIDFFLRGAARSGVDASSRVARRR